MFNKLLLKINQRKINEIAKYIFETGCNRTSNQSNIAYYNEITREFGVSEKWLRKYHDDIADAIWNYGELLDIQDSYEWDFKTHKSTDIIDGWDMMIAGTEVCARCGYKGEYCDGCEVCHDESEE